MDESLRKVTDVFRILLVDDDPAGAHLFRELMKNLQRRHELHFARDGVDALEFLHRKGPHAGAPRPHLILLDINMPRLGGHETLSAIKGDPALSAIPVIMLSTSGAREDIRRSYQARANCYVRKPTTLEGNLKLMQALETFWMEFVLLAEHEEERQRSHSGPKVALAEGEASSRAIRLNDPPEGTAMPSNTSGCGEYKQLLDELSAAVRELIELHEQQLTAIVEGDSECHRFDLLIHMATEKKQLAKYACLRHVEEHGCLKFNAIDSART
jgi:CheY-like chemotaxis protein